MSDETILIPTSKEEVAFKLTEQLMDWEASRRAVPTDDAKAHRKYYLDLYAECLYATRGLRNFD